jgi:hypothetical protein
VVRRWIWSYKVEGDKGLDGKSRKKKSSSIHKPLSHDESLVEENKRILKRDTKKYERKKEWVFTHSFLYICYW